MTCVLSLESYLYCLRRFASELPGGGVDGVRRRHRRPTTASYLDKGGPARANFQNLYQIGESSRYRDRSILPQRFRPEETR